MSDFDDQTAVVTGAGSGIGRAAALAFAEKGAAVVIADINREDGQKVVAEIDKAGGDATFVRTDVTDSDAVVGMVDAAVEEYGSLDFALNNAGIRGERHPVQEYPRDAWEDVIDTNLTAVWACLKREAERMIDQDEGGVIVNTASVVGKSGLSNGASYAAAKHGILGLTRTAAMDLAQHDIRVNAVCPGYIETPMLTQSDGDRVLDKETREKLESLQPMDRLGQPQEIGSAVTWLCSEEASFVTGESVNVDGGYLAGK